MTNAAAEEKMFEDSKPADPSIENTTDPWPWLIRNLVEKQADRTDKQPEPKITEPPKDSP